jgi:hypothetical protein
MKRIVLGAVAAASLFVAGTARAETFTTVDGMRAAYSALYVTGIVEGETTPREIFFPFDHTYVEERHSCERFLLLAITKPGQYKVTLTRQSTSFTNCTLARVAP